MKWVWKADVCGDGGRGPAHRIPLMLSRTECDAGMAASGHTASVVTAWEVGYHSLLTAEWPEGSSPKLSGCLSSFRES